jgi:hypothetical protein
MSFEDYDLASTSDDELTASFLAGSSKMIASVSNFCWNYAGPVLYRSRDHTLGVKLVQAM